MEHAPVGAWCQFRSASRFKKMSGLSILPVFLLQVLGEKACQPVRIMWWLEYTMTDVVGADGIRKSPSDLCSNGTLGILTGACGVPRLWSCNATYGAPSSGARNGVEKLRAILDNFVPNSNSLAWN